VSKDILSSIRKDWDTPEEDKAWEHLQDSEPYCQFCGERFDLDNSIHIIKDGFHPFGNHDYYEFTHFCKNGIVLFVKGKTKKDVIEKLSYRTDPMLSTKQEKSTRGI